MDTSPLMAISPIEGRYYDKVAELRPILSEYGLFRYRILIEIRWLQCLAHHPKILELPPFNPLEIQGLNAIFEAFNVEEAARIKTIEATIRHDVKAVEYFLKEKISETLNSSLQVKEFIHFACTSEDINNLAYGLMLKEARSACLLPLMENLITQLKTWAEQTATYAMLGRTHGQAAIPTTVGKEFANVAHRLHQQYTQFSMLALCGKFNGAIGNYNAHTIAYPEINWPLTSKEFVESLGLQWMPYSTQIASHDDIVFYCDTLRHFNNILINFSSDMWSYIALGYFKQHLNTQEVGSSTMPHKINPIDFENAESNLSLANSLLYHLSNHLMYSRWQRDLRDSSLLRNIGTALAHSVLAWKNISTGLSKLQADTIQLHQDLETHWEVLAEAIQTVLRRYGHEFPYEQLKHLTRGKQLNQAQLHQFIRQLNLPENIKQELLKLTPKTYLGYAVELSRGLSL